MSKRNRRWFKIYDALTPFAVSQGDCEQMTNEVVRALTADNARYRKLLDAIVDEYNGQIHGPALASVEAARAELEGKE